MDSEFYTAEEINNYNEKYYESVKKSLNDRGVLGYDKIANAYENMISDSGKEDSCTGSVDYDPDNTPKCSTVFSYKNESKIDTKIVALKLAMKLDNVYSANDLVKFAETIYQFIIKE